MAVVYPLMLLLYIRLCVYIQRLKHPGSSHSRSFNLRKTKNKKSIDTTLIILGTFTFCWLPNFLFQTTMSVYAEITWPKAPEGSTLNLLRKVDKVFVILLLFNCCADPVIYSFRLQELRMRYKHLFCCLGHKPSPDFIIIPQPAARSSSCV